MERHAGATLLELIVVLAVSAVLVAIALPAYSAFASRSRLATAVNGFLASLHLARSEAIKRGSRAVICKSSSGVSCATGGDWNQGWLVFHDANNNAARESGEARIQSWPALPPGMRFNGNLLYVSYASDGASKQLSGAWQGGTLTICDERNPASSGRQIVINSTGRARTGVLAACP